MKLKQKLSDFMNSIHALYQTLQKSDRRAEDILTRPWQKMESLSTEKENFKRQREDENNHSLLQRRKKLFGKEAC